MTRWAGRIGGAVAALLTLAAIAWAADLPSRLGFAPYSEQFLALVLGLSLVLVFLQKPSAEPRLDYALAAIGGGAALWVMAAYPSLIARQMSVPLDGLVLGGILVLLVLEGLRRTVGWALVLVVVTIVVIGLLGHHIPGALQTREVAPERLLLYVGFDANGLFGKVLMVAAAVVISFVLFGQLLLKSGGADFFNDIAIATMGRRRGGSAKIAVVASGLFGSISGVVVSNIVATGVVTIRMMTRSGYRPHQAAAIEAVASTGGQIVPPVMGAVAFLMADILQRPYAEIVVAAIVPALLYYVAVFAQADLQAAKDDIALVDPSEIPSARSVLRKGWVFAVPFAAIVLALFTFGQRPETAALWGGGTALAIGLLVGYGQRMRLAEVWLALIETGRSVTDIIMIAAAAGFIIGVLNVTGLGFGLTWVLVDLGSGSLFLLLLISAVICIVLGMGMPTVGVYLLLAVLIAPSLVQSGVDPIAAHLFIFYLGMMSMVTPPVAIGAFFAASIAKAPPMKTAVTAMRYGWTAYVIPFLFVMSPTLILRGPPLEVAFDVLMAVLGVYAISAAAVGWLRGPLHSWSRAALCLAGALILAPSGSIWIMIVGVGVFASIFCFSASKSAQPAIGE
ncbi:TRAP transporter fused permease subunit [Pontivivens ytuae]|uniref:TRAP transporter fused permease subunit n=1 Tax=Pontivivens ytuae TaxID=2789856 RepID=A0A7S9LUN4_9RHOB|nr:TRAP transporter fused permease subunit [Pontivivens ytuae]